MTETLVTRGQDPWPESATLGAVTDPLRRRILERALLDVGVMEFPPNSNRGERIDRWLRRAHVPEELITSGRGWYCGCVAGAWWIDAGAKVPRDYGNCDAWLPFIQPNGYSPRPGDMVLYGQRTNAKHIGLVVVTVPFVTIEGNRALDGKSNNGVGVLMAPSFRNDVIGFVAPQAV